MLGRRCRAWSARSPPAAGSFNRGSTYLALGDSLAYGYHQAQFEEELKAGDVNPATFDEGYVDDFGKLLNFFNPHPEKIINDGCPGRRPKRSSRARA